MCASSGRRLFLRALIASIAASFTLPPLLTLYARARLRRGPAPTVGWGETAVSVRGGCMDLPLPRLDGSVSVERALADRRSIREYTGEPLTVQEVAQLLWAAYGITETRFGLKTSPSAGATYPAEIYLVAGEHGVKLGPESYLEPGSYHYNPYSHRLCMVRRGELRHHLYRAAWEQEWVRDAPASIVVTVVFERTTSRYGQRGVRYVWMEVGHIGQNIYLQATALGLATVAVGAFNDEEVRKVVGAPPEHKPAYIMPVGRPASPYHLNPGDLERYIRANRRGQA